MSDLRGFGVDPERLIDQRDEPLGVNADGTLVERTTRTYDASGLAWPDVLPGEPV